MNSTLAKINDLIQSSTKDATEFFPLGENDFDDRGHYKARMKAVREAVHVAYGMGIDTMMVGTSFHPESDRLDTFEVFCVYKRRHRGTVYKTQEISLEFTKKTGKLVGEYILSEKH